MTQEAIRESVKKNINRLRGLSDEQVAHACYYPAYEQEYSDPVYTKLNKMDHCYGMDEHGTLVIDCSERGKRLSREFRGIIHDYMVKITARTMIRSDYLYLLHTGQEALTREFEIIARQRASSHG